MNAKRRKQLEKATAYISLAYSIIEEVRDDEQEAYNNLPESIQDSERGETMIDNISVFDDALGYLDDVTDGIEEITST